ncbi:hypothetical protein U9M48_008430 [Paspalum notatum var. saurae]|uniref:Uncharacterized protein n=1 Tax=Paspalum notatum var. saurae TaxID=547442 RepID=A0AAQ3SNZ0_PASNO
MAPDVLKPANSSDPCIPRPSPLHPQADLRIPGQQPLIRVSQVSVRILLYQSAVRIQYADEYVVDACPASTVTNPPQYQQANCFQEY